MNEIQSYTKKIDKNNQKLGISDSNSQKHQKCKMNIKVKSKEKC